MNRLIISCLFFISLCSTAWSQTCCSGGVPLSSNLGLPVAEANNLQLSLSYDLNILNTLMEGTGRIDDQSRNRKTHSTLWQIGYSISNRFSVDALFSYVRQERTIRNDLSENFVATNGVGDVVLLLKYRLWENKGGTSNWTLGLGSKLATGAADKSNDQGILLNADLQPGSGAYDAILWTQYTQTGLLRPSMGFFATITHNRRGVNKNYLPVFDPVSGTNRGQAYQFGNEWQMILGLSDRLTFGSLIVDPGLSLRFRSVQYDRINDQRLPGTGGSWWFVNPNLAYWPTPDFSINANVELPLYSNIIGTQLSPTIRLNLGIFYRLSLKKDGPALLNTPVFKN